MLIGSEGILGVITEAWVRVQERPRFRASAGVLFDGFEQGAEAVRALAQSGLYPSNCRLLDPGEAALTGAAPDGRGAAGARLRVGRPPARRLDRRAALELCGDHGGEVPASRHGERGESEGAWRDAFLQAPYLRDTLIAGGILAETFETAITWDRFDAFVAEVRERPRAALGAGRGHLPPHPRLPRRRGALLHGARARRGAARSSSSGTRSRPRPPRRSSAAGGTITHHHAVGRDHRPWYDRQRPEPFADALRAAKAAVDPQGILNPGVLIDP